MTPLLALLLVSPGGAGPLRDAEIEVRVQPFWGAGHFSYGTAIVRGVWPAPGCQGAEVVVATGHDHGWDYAPRLLAGTLAGCAPAREGVLQYSLDALHYTTAVAADFCRDGGDEVVLATLAGADSRVGYGQIRLASLDRRTAMGADRAIDGSHTGLDEPPCGPDGPCWREYLVDEGASVLSLAVADLDADGALDLIAGTAWEADAGGPGTPPAFVTGLRGADLLGATLVYFGATTTTEAGCALSFSDPVRLDGARGVTAIEVQDLDADGRPDLLFAGRAVQWVRGDGTRALGAPRTLVPDRADGRFQWFDVDAAPRGGAVTVAASRACFAASECAGLLREGVPMGIDRWRFTGDAVEALPFAAVPGVPGAARFADLGPSPEPDLLVGMMLTRARAAGGCPRDRRLEGHCPGGPLLVGVGDAPLARLIAPEAPLMGIRAEPFAFDGAVRCEPAQGRFVTYGGDGTPVGAELFAGPCASPTERPSGEPLPTHFVVGQRWASLAVPKNVGEGRPAIAVGSVVWREAPSAPLLISNALDASALGNVVIEPTTREVPHVE